jgi:hypothetical protein
MLEKELQSQGFDCRSEKVPFRRRVSGYKYGIKQIGKTMRRART